MVLQIVTLVCILLNVQFCLAHGNCYSASYTLIKPSKCQIRTTIEVDFPINSTLPLRSKCEPSETVCVEHVTIGTTFGFYGNFSNITEVTTDGTWQPINIPVVHYRKGQSFADPMVGIFVHANEVPYAGALEFTVNIDDAEVIAMGNLRKGNSSDCEVGKLCFQIAGKLLKIWGTKGALTSITVNGKDNKIVVIPLIIRKQTAHVVPPLLAVPENEIIRSPLKIVVHYAFEGVSSNQRVIREKKACNDGDACYERIEAPVQSTFSGTIPPEPLTITLKGRCNMETVTYTFSSAGNKITIGVVTLYLYLYLLQ